MAYNPLERLENGNVAFIYNLSGYDYDGIIQHIRKSPKKEQILDGFFELLKDNMPFFCFEIVYDIEKYKDYTYKILHERYKYDSFSKDKFEEMLNNSKVVEDYLKENFDKYIKLYEKDLDFIFEYLFNHSDTCFKELELLSVYENLHIRYLFMKYLIVNRPKDISKFYDDIVKYLTSNTYKENEQLTLFPTYMDVDDISKLAVLLLNDSKKTYHDIKQFILMNYEYNNLAKELIDPIEKKQSENVSYFIDNEKGIEEFKNDADLYFKTALVGRLNILNIDKFANMVSKSLLKEYKNSIKLFRTNNNDYSYNVIESYGLSRVLEKIVSKYLSISKNKEVKFLAEGSTSKCYKVGDYVLKLDTAKWSYEDVICPDLYLINPNLEEIYIRDEKGIIRAGIEVQKYLKNDIKDVPDRIFVQYNRTLKRLGYYLNDHLRNGPMGDNCRLLDSYKDAGIKNPPDWFKEYPLVLVDRDMVYKIENKRPKQLSSGY